MSAITEFTKKNCSILDAAILAALEPLAQQHGLTVALKGGTYSDLSLILKVEFKVLATKDGKDVERAEFEKYCSAFYCTPEHYGRELRINGKMYTLIGFMPNRPKYPIKVRNTETGKVTLFVERVLKQLGVVNPIDEQLAALEQRKLAK